MLKGGGVRRRKAQPIETGGIFTRIVSEYAPDSSMFRRDEEEMHDLKEAIFYGLTEAERNTLIAYAECQSYRELAQLLGVGRTTAKEEIHRIRAKIIGLMKEKGHDY